MEYDAIIVGAGPAGSTAAADLALRGHKVALFDRQAFPREKTCGDGIPPGTIGALNELGMGEKIRAAGFYPIHAIRIGSPSGRVWETQFKAKRPGAQFYVAPRERFDTLIYERAVEAGAEFIRADVRGPLFDDDRVVGVRAAVDGREAAYRSRVVIAADGATSVIGRALHPQFKGPAKHRAVAVRAYVDGIELLPHRVEFYFDKRFIPGYAWVFPMGGRRANVGVFVSVDALRRKKVALKELLREFLDFPAIKMRLDSNHSIERAGAWQLGFGTNRPVRRAFNGALLAGDAGSLVDPLTGEGIHNAVYSARIAAGVVSEALRNGDVSPRALSEYDDRCEAALGNSLKRSYYVSRLTALAPWWVDVLFLLANANRRRFGSFLNRMSTDFVVDA